MDKATKFLEKRNITIGSRRTTVQLETYFWKQLDLVLDTEQLSLNLLCHEIHERRCDYSMAQSLRLFIIMYYIELTRVLQKSQPLGDDYILFEPDDDTSPSVIQILNVFSQHAQHVSGQLKQI